MPIDAGLRDLVARIGTFHITHRATKQAQAAMEAAVANDTVDERRRAAYICAVRKYFEEFDKEARSHLRDVDRRLEQINQVHFNLTAERGVAVKRIEGTRGVLDALDSLTDATP